MRPTGVRRFLLPAALVLGVVSAAGVGSPFQAAGAAAGGQGDWTQYRFDHFHTGFNAAETTLSASNVAGLTQSWAADSGDFLGAVPIRVGNRVIAGDHQGYLWALDAATGDAVWKRHPGIMKSWIVWGNLVIAGRSSAGYSGAARLYAYDIQTGDTIWQDKFGKGLGPQLTAVGDRLYMTGSFNVEAFDAATGDVIWNVRVGAHVAEPATVAKGLLYIATDTRLLALNTADGSQAWSAKVNGARWSPVVVGHTLYVTGGTTLFTFDAISGVPGWSADLGSVLSAPAVAHGVIYVATDAGSYALDASDGGERWSAPFGSALTAPMVANGVVYLSSEPDGSVLALVAADGSKAWEAFPGDSDYADPVVSNGSVYVTAHQGGAHALFAFGLP